ncbi:unnamed protein product, partial [Mesorhabditis spiculigera]
MDRNFTDVLSFVSYSEPKTGALHQIFIWLILIVTCMVTCLILLRLCHCVGGYCRDFRPLTDVDQIRRRYERHWQQFELLENPPSPRRGSFSHYDTELQPVTNHI